MDGPQSYWEVFSSYQYILQVVFVAVSQVLIFNKWRADWRGVLKFIVHFIGYCACFFGIACAFFYLLLPFNLNILNFWLISLAMTVAYPALVCRRWDLRIKLAMEAFFFAVVSIVIEFGGAFSFLVFDYLDSSALRSFTIALIPAFAIVVKVFPLYKFDEIGRILFTFTMIINLLVAVVTLVNIIVTFGYATPSYLNMIMAAAVYCILVIVYLMAYYLMMEEREKLILEEEKREGEFNKVTSRLLESKLSDMRQIRHEIKNQFSYLSILLEGKRYDEMREYFSEIQSDFSAIDAYIDCGNRTVNGIINMEIAKARLRDIEIKTKLIVPQVLPFSDIDLSSILCNLIDNAIEACVRQEIDNAAVSVVIMPRKEYLYICVMNPLSGKEDRKQLLALNTSKDDLSRHGLGTKIVSRIARRYNGYATYSIEEDKYFMAEVMLDLAGGAAKERK